ncbi:hypothetical protein C8F01DRAFT_1366677 [Mycena amicta]|nr:hypothetical protein C8F01DRAFT_1366677 [Mycena amicta]
MPPRRSARFSPVKAASASALAPAPLATVLSPPAASHDSEDENDDDDDDDDEAPVAVPQSQAKRQVQTAQRRKEEARAQVNRATRAKRNAAGKVKAKEDDEGQDKVGMEEEESRMERAMREAAEESDQEDDEQGEGSVEVDEDDEAMSSDNDEEKEDESDEQADEDMPDAASDGDANESATSPRLCLCKTPSRAPLHLRLCLYDTEKAVHRAYTCADEKAKTLKEGNGRWPDVHNSTRTIRVESIAPRAIPATLPSRKVRQFTERALGLQGGKGRKRKGGKGWERLPAAIGVLRPHHASGAPAARFVRNPV